MERLITFCATVTVTLCFSATSWALITIDGDLSDWGVNPFTDWIPDSPTADYWETNNINEYEAYGYEEKYDFEALYFDDDLDNLYFAVVSSYPVPFGDLGIDLNDDFSVTKHGVVSGLEYAVRVNTLYGNKGDVVQNPIWLDTYDHEWPDGWQGSPWRAAKGSGTVIGSASVASLCRHFGGVENSTYLLEIAVDKDLLPWLTIGDKVTSHFTQWCGNDSINLTGVIDYIPAPSTILLDCIGVSLVCWLRRLRKL